MGSIVQGLLEGCVVEEGGALDSPNCRTVHAHWLALGKGDENAKPQVGAFSLIDLHQQAHSMILKDVVDGGADFRNRFWGSRVSQAFGIDATGQTTADYYQGKYRNQVLELYRLVAAAVRPVTVKGRSGFFDTKNFVRFDSLYLPLFDETGRARQIIVVYDFLVA